ncbi:MAG: GDP-mannose-dependent alpha-(1-2)-phosphatidylinositol mannosyltransferase [Frankiales bacterium]|nr:GDP-mannose-dependent alpha-(1-2)-phosphatidylinositol mannosyltransferase [Frankiales bacterium]
MRIAHVTDFYLPRLGGIEMHVGDLAARQVAQGHEVTVITSSPGEGTTDPADGPAVVRVTDGLRRPHAFHPQAPFSGAKELLDGRFDMVHVHVGVASPLGFWAARTASRAGLPTVVTVHSLWAWAHPIFQALDRPGGYSRLPIRWTAVSEAAAGPVRRVVSGPGAVTVLPNGIDPERWDVPRDDRGDDDEILLVGVMRLAARKRPLQMLRMVREVRRRTPAGTRLRVVIVGEGPYRSRLERYLRRHEMTGWVSLPGRQGREQIRDLYRRADVFVAPADLESFGIAALEARCAGVPVVAKGGNGISEFVRDGRDGLLVADDAAMVDALVRVCAEPALRAALAGHAGAGTVPVSWTSTLALTDDAYREAAELVGRGASPARTAQPEVIG